MVLLPVLILQWLIPWPGWSLMQEERLCLMSLEVFAFPKTQDWAVWRALVVPMHWQQGISAVTLKLISFSFFSPLLLKSYLIDA